ncbi:MAG: selenide, water dikinase SelD [Bacteroidota bacterium]
MGKFNLLSTVEYGGCSAKLSPKQLESVLSGFPVATDPRLLVDITTHDDAGVYQLNEETALIFTTDFFPPVCADAYEFGQIAAANALSDIYAMGGTPLMALNIMMFSVTQIPVEEFGEILRGGYDKVTEAGALIVGGHTIDDHPPKYGLAVLGTVHPARLQSNATARPGDQLILTKPLGTGALVAAQRNGLCSDAAYRATLEQMKLLNKEASKAAADFEVHSTTDITGFGLLGHALKMAEASRVSMRIRSRMIPLLPEAYTTFNSGCIPGAAFRNLEFTGDRVHYAMKTDYNLKMLAHDAQTSGGLLFSVASGDASALLEAIKATGLHPDAALIGEVLEESPRRVYFE